MKYLRRFLGALAVVLLLLQLVPVERTNPPVTEEIGAPREVLAILRRSCYDCHSNETRWPWYARVAPAKFLLVRDVEEAREHLNFSRWDTYAADERAHLLEELWEEVEAGEMPLWFYVPLHPEAKLSEADLATLRTWTASASEH